jgi:Carboxypeptidase regulatory-like domain
MRIQRLSYLGLSLVIFLGLLGPLAAFGQGGEADIAGVVADPSGAAIQTAQVTLTNTDTGVTRTINAQESGEYRFASVAPGHYSVSVKSAGFSAESISALTVSLGEHLQENFSLKPGNDNQTVTVDGGNPLIDPADNSVGAVISNEQIDTLPISQRQYLNLATLLPGTSQDATRTFYNNVQSGGGGYFYANGFMLDGVTNTWAEQGEPRQDVPEGAVQEFRVYVSQFPAEFGLAMGGMTVVATKSGTNSIHGEAFEYFRNDSLSAPNAFQSTNPPYLRNQFGGDIGGPIWRNHTHYYGAYERTQTDQSYTLSPGLPQFYSSDSGTFDEPGHVQLLTLRGDHQISNNQQIFVRYAQQWELRTRQGCGGSNTQYCYDGEIPRHSIVVGHTWEPFPAAVNEVHFQNAYSSYQLGPYNEPIPSEPNQLTAANFHEISTGYAFPSFTYGKVYAQVGIEKHDELNDTFSLQHGKHTYKFGGDGIYIPYVDSSAENSQGTFYFSTDQLFDPNNPATIAALTNPYLYTATIPPIVTNLPSAQLGLFAQDDWKILPTLSLSLGLRYDREFDSSFLTSLNPADYTPRIPFQGDPSKRGARANFGPRFGLTWDPFHKGAGVFRAGYGLYYNNIQTELNEAEKQNLQVCNITISNPSYPDPFGGKSASDFCSTAPPNVTVLSPSFRNSYGQQFTLGYSHQFTPTLALAVDGVFQHLLRDFRVVDLNYPVNYPTNMIRPLTAWGQIDQHASIGRAIYKALYVRVDKRMSKRYFGTISYTLSSAQDANPQTNVTDYANYQLDYGPSTIDRRHALIVSGSVLLRGKIMVGGIWSWRSSLPFSAYQAGADIDGVAQYVPGTSRDQGNRDLSLTAVNAYRTMLDPTHLTLPTITSHSIQSSEYDDFDVRISRPLFVHGDKRVELIGQAFNLFGHKNLLGPNMTTNAGAANFGKITNANNAQQGELAARFVF